MIYDEGNDWDNEDTEGPYIDTLRTKYVWGQGVTWKITRMSSPYRDNDSYILYNPYIRTEIPFNTIEQAKQYADTYDQKETNNEPRSVSQGASSTS